MPIALTREVSPAIVRCELTYLKREPIDVELAVEQHRAYEARLVELGCRVQRLPAEPDLADSVFVEDSAVVLPELAVIARPGAASREAEIRSAADALRPYRSLASINGPASLDGGDVLVVGRRVYVGESGRTNSQAVAQLRLLLSPHGYEVLAVPVRGCLHLKTAATLVAERTLLLNPDWVDPAVFSGLRRIEVDPEEPFAGNALLVRRSVVYPTENRVTARKLERAGIEVCRVPFSELAKAEAGVTCCSVIFEP
ncbi:MAG: dimethylarginine dimethylaminohydrolase family protein [Anaerolineales bacterium]